MPLETDVALAALAGLLHDIGKFMLRADVAGSRIWDDQARADFGYKHAMLSATFVEQYVPAPWRSQVAGPVGNHHRPRTPADKVVQLADRLSAGERADRVDGEEPRTVHPKQLRSIFTRVTVEDQGHPGPQDAYLPLAPLKMAREVLFPGPALADDAAWAAYRALWEAFSREAAQLRDVHTGDGDLETYLESLLLLMQRFTWCIPSAYYGSVPDISLYDHSRMTGALAAVLARDGVNEAQLDAWLAGPEQATDEIALLVAGDLSGVQDFIYTITARGATPGLRGRSFYLQLLTEATARFVLTRLGLPITNLVYAGGGNFYLLAHPQAATALPTIRRELDRILLQQHRGQLYLAVAGAPLTGQDFFQGRIAQAWGRLHEALQRVKQRRFADLPPAELTQLFQPLGHGGNEDTQCQVCGQEHPQTRTDNDTRKCPACLAFEDLGDALRNARFLALDLDPAPPAPASPDLDQAAETWEAVLAALGMQATVTDTPIRLPNPAGGKRRVLLALDDAGLAEVTPTPQVAAGRRLLVNTTPIFTAAERTDFLADPSFPETDKKDLPPAGKVKPFGVLAHQAQGIKRLGVLRMDVDNLGQIFREGLGDHATLSRVAGLSAAVSLYFEGWVGALAEQMKVQGWGDRLYAIYSGGDDLFFVGSWDAVVELAIRIRADLDAYTAGHSAIHASGGLALARSKYPLYQAAQDAGQAEDAAKDLRWSDPRQPSVVRRKDAFCFLHEPLPWRRFGLETDCGPGLDTAHRLMHFLVDLVRGRAGEDGKAAPKALLRRLLGLYEQYVEAREAWQGVQGGMNQVGRPQALWGPWTWRSVYVLARMKERTKQTDIQTLMDELKASDYRIMDRIGVAARWADLYTRGREG